jgi:hypothetical protein
MATYKVGGPALTSAMAGIRQAACYCLDHGAAYAALTTGITWIIFLPFPVVGVPYTEGAAYVFPTLDSIIDNFALFYDLLSREGVTQRNYDVHFAKASGLTVETFEPMAAANRNEYIRLLQSTELAADLEHPFPAFPPQLFGLARQLFGDEPVASNAGSCSQPPPSSSKRSRMIVPPAAS